MKIDLIGMILNTAGRRHFDGLISNDGKPLDAIACLDYMIMEYANARKGGYSATVVVPRQILEAAASEHTPSGTWPAVCHQRTFVEGAKWWQWKNCGSTAFASELDLMEAEAVARFGEPNEANNG